MSHDDKKARKDIRVLLEEQLYIAPYQNNSVFAMLHLFEAADVSK